jgi:hypothetical protein
MSCREAWRSHVSRSGSAPACLALAMLYQLVRPRCLLQRKASRDYRSKLAGGQAVGTSQPPQSAGSQRSACRDLCRLSN